MPGSKGRIKFRIPKVNEFTITNANHINLRKEALLSSKVVGILNVYSRVQILSKGKKENILPWGTFYWFKVKANMSGWVFGAFLEPVEEKTN